MFFLKTRLRVPFAHHWMIPSHTWMASVVVQEREISRIVEMATNTPLVLFSNGYKSHCRQECSRFIVSGFVEQ